MSSLAGGYSIARSAGVCAATGRPLQPGEPVVVAIAEADGGGFARFDFAQDAWRDDAAAPGGRPFFARWQSVCSKGGPRPGALLDDAELLDLFFSLAEDGEAAPHDRGKAAFRFVLALLLTRRRLLRVAGSKAGVLLVRRAGDGEATAPIEVVDPGLDADALREATAMLGSVMRGDA